MDLERRQSDRAHLDKTFRAAHSLKGAAAMVGLGAVAEFTHGIEAVLDRIRSGSLAVDSDIITTLLEARDHLAAMVEAEAARSPIPPSGELTQRLRAFVAAEGRHTPGRPPQAAVRRRAVPAEAAQTESRANGRAGSSARGAASPEPEPKAKAASRPRAGQSKMPRKTTAG